jgi:hypothetical protein
MSRNRDREVKPVYNRKILRSMLKYQLKSNKINAAWHRLMGYQRKDV